MFEVAKPIANHPKPSETMWVSGALVCQAEQTAHVANLAGSGGAQVIDATIHGHLHPFSMANSEITGGHLFQLVGHETFHTVYSNHMFLLIPHNPHNSGYLRVCTISKAVACAPV